MKNLFARRKEWQVVDLPPSFAESGSSAARVLVESSDLAERWAVETILRRAGFEVVTCGGPALLAGHACPLVAGSGCPGVASADAVFYRLDLPDSANANVLRALKREAERRPVVVEVAGPRVERLAELLEGCQVLPMPATADDMVEALSRATGVAAVE